MMVELGGNRTPPRVWASYLVKGYRPWPGHVFGCPPVTASDLEWPAFDALLPPHPPFSRPSPTSLRTRVGPAANRDSAAAAAWWRSVERTGARPVRFPRHSSHAPLQRRDSPARSTISTTGSRVPGNGRPAADAVGRLVSSISASRSSWNRDGFSEIFHTGRRARSRASSKAGLTVSAK